MSRQNAGRSTLSLAMALTLLGVLSMVLASCSRQTSPSDDGRVRVLVSIPPLAGLVEALLPEGAQVQTLIPPGSSVHSYQLRPDDRARVAGADVGVLVGLGLAGGASPLLTSAGDRLIRFDHVAELEGEDAHAGHDHDHDHAHTIDPHLWLDPDLTLRLIDELETRLSSLDGVDPAALRERSEALRVRVREMDAAYAATLADRKGRAIVTHHDAWSRLADRYGLRVAAVLRPVASGEPTPGEMARAREAIQREGVATIFVEPQFDAALARRLAQNAGVKVAVLDPIGDGDWFAMMRANLDALVGGIPASEPKPQGP